MTALVWREEPPDRPGWWWMKCGAGPLDYVPMRVVVFKNHLQVRIGDLRPVGELECEWAGPLSEPEEEKR